jgi:hypothetical protein
MFGPQSAPGFVRSTTFTKPPLWEHMQVINHSPEAALSTNGEGKISVVERAALNILAACVGIVIAFVIWNVTVNLLLYHTLSEPKRLPEGTDLGAGFLFLMTLPELFILLPLCGGLSVWLLQKLR